MQSSGIPNKFTILFASSAGGGYIRTVPTASQIGVHDGWASFTDGFPPLNFQPVASGGVPPFGQDMNGLFKAITAWNQWAQAGGPVAWDSAFSTAIGGYPMGAQVASSTTLGLYWICTVENNTSNPDTGGAGWFSAQQRGVAIYDIVGGTQKVSINGAAYTTVGSTTFPVLLASQYARVRLTGAGGGGGGCNSGGLGGAGGGGGYVEGVVSGLTSATTVTVGSGGVGGNATTPGIGSSGGGSGFGSLAAGGGAGGQAISGVGAALSGAGGTATGGNIANKPGTYGSTGFFISAGNGFAAVGGGTFLGGTGSILTGATASVGAAGAYEGVGGGGGLISAAGGAGNNGRVIVEY